MILCKWKAFFWMSCIFFSCCVLADESFLPDTEEAMIIESGEAQYNGNEIELLGDVSVQHSLGHITARKLSIAASDAIEKKGRFNILKISEDVQIKFQGGGELCCQSAEIDYFKLQGLFSGTQSQPDVIYNAYIEEGADKTKLPIIIKSLQMVVDLERSAPPEGGAAKTVVKEIQAQGDVRVSYHDDYLVVADKAIFQKTPSDGRRIADGVLTLSMESGEDPFCQMDTKNGDKVEARVIRMDTVAKQVQLEQTKGSLAINHESKNPGKIEFNADRLTWDSPDQTLHLEGGVDLIQDGNISIHTDHEVFIDQKLIDGKKTLKTFRSPRDTSIAFLEVKEGTTHKIISPGPMLIDHEAHQITLQGLPQEKGEEGEGTQVYIEDLQGEMYADHLLMTYSREEGKIVPDKVILEGHVRLLNRFDGHIQEAGSILHYALADRVEYLPKEQEMVLTGMDGSRVLLYDKVNNVQMSATALMIKRDAKTKKDSIKGVGDVRFTFIERELSQLKKRFKMEESNE